MCKPDQLILITRPGRKPLQLPEQRRLLFLRSELRTLHAQVLKDLFGGCVPDVVYELQSAPPRDRVRWIDDDSKKRQHVFYVSRLGKLDPAVLAKWNPVLCQLDLEVKGMSARAKQDCDLAVGHSLVPQLVDALRDKPRLLVLVAGAD